MDQENVAYTYRGVLLNHKEQKYVLCRKVDGTEDHHVKQNNVDSESQISHIVSNISNLDLRKVHESRRDHLGRGRRPVEEGKG
jgi:hypothetical protein